MELMIYLISGLIAAAATGVGMVWWGWRGKRIDDHPLCRKCGYDLTGRPEGSNKCSECGASLSDAKAMRIGHRRRRRGWIAAGLALLLPTIAVAGLMVTVAVRKTDMTPYKPFWWLVREMNDETPAGAAKRTVAMAELGRRAGLGKLSKSELAQLLEMAIEAQGDVKRPWNANWIGLAQALRAKCPLSREQLDRVYAQEWPWQLHLRPRVARGEPLVFGAGHGEQREFPTGLASNGWATHYRVTKLELDGVNMDFGGEYTGGDRYVPNWAFQGGGSGDRAVAIPPALLATLADGKHTVTATIAYSTYADYMQKTRNIDGQTRATATFVLLAREEASTVATTMPAEKAQAVREAFRVEKITVSRDGKSLRFDITGRDPSVHISSAVFVWAAGKELGGFGAFNCSPQMGGSWGMQGQVDGFPPDVQKADVILRPDKGPAAQTMDTTQIWGGEIVIENVPVVRE